MCVICGSRTEGLACSIPSILFVFLVAGGGGGGRNLFVFYYAIESTRREGGRVGEHQSREQRHMCVI
jgi:hypothetical protein